jgi:hypothetical protein
MKLVEQNCKIRQGDVPWDTVPWDMSQGTAGLLYYRSSCLEEHQRA